MDKKNIAVFFGGKSFEHDVSILTGLEACQSLDFEKYNIIPVYLDITNNMWTGNALLDRRFYPLKEWGRQSIQETRILVGESKPTLQVKKQGLFFDSYKKINFDVALLAFHGDYGENGFIQGLCEIAGIPYTGCRPLSASLCMNKIIAKSLVKSVGVPVLPDHVIKKPITDVFYDISTLTNDMPFDFPVIVKPTSLGSSIGVSKANSKDELNASVMQVFALGDNAMIEPFVQNLEEYNVSVTKSINGDIETSVVENPFKENAEFLGFFEKYLSSKNGKIGCKKSGSKLCSASERSGMISMTREFNPKKLTKEQLLQLQEWAKKSFDVLQCNGIIRTDFMYNNKTKEFYFTETNTIPGSFAYYLWEASEPSYTYLELMNFIIQEALELNKSKKGDVILSNSHSTIFK